MKRYRCMPNAVVEDGAFRIEAVQPNHIESIRVWRNQQMDVLRQAATIEPQQQVDYYEKHIWPTMQTPKPANILVSYLENDRLVGYGGLVHIVWAEHSAEVSFLLDPALVTDPETYRRYQLNFFALLKSLAFNDLDLKHLTTETYAHRVGHIQNYADAGFVQVEVVANAVLIEGVATDALVHRCSRRKQPSVPEDTSKKLGKVLVSSASKKVPLIQALSEAVRRINPEARVIAGDISPEVLSRYAADSFWELPRTTSENVDALLSGCAQRGVTAILPTRDGELAFWAEQSERFAEAGISILISPPEAIAACFDKLAFASSGSEKGLPFIPAGLSPDDVGPGPYAVKERFGAGARDIGLNLDRDAALAHAKSLKAPIYQPFVVGREISIDAWLDRECKVKGLVLRSRDVVVDGESQVTTTFRDPSLEAAARETLEALGLRGPVVMQVLINANDKVNVVECNPRFGGASTTSLKAGLDSFYWSLLEACGEDVAKYPFERVDGEIRLVRVPHDLTFHDSSF